MIKILHVITDLDRGGAETVLYRLMREVTEDANQRHVVISLRDRGFFGDKLEALGVAVYELGISKPLELLGGFFRLVRLMGRERPDLVHTWLYHADFLGGIAARFYGRLPVLWGVHTVHLDQDAGLSTRVIRNLCARASSWLPSAIICVARATVESHAELGYERGKMLLVPNGFDLPDIESLRCEARALRESLGFSERQQVVGCVGRFHPDKDYSTFLRAASLLREREPEVRFLLIGKDLSTSNEMLMSWISGAGLQSCVVTLGERNDISTCLLAMDVFCLPSQTEAFPLALGEAMAAARPVVATDVGDAALLVGDAGVVVPPRNAELLCDGLHYMLQRSTKEREDFGIAARNRIEKSFSMKSMVRQMVKIYRTVSFNRQDS